MTIRVNYFSTQPTLGLRVPADTRKRYDTENKTLNELQADCLHMFVLKEAIYKDSKIFKKDHILVKNAFS